MGYWVINQHLESHLLISEGHPWGIWDPLSRPKTLHMKCLHHPQCLSTQLWPSRPFHPATQPGPVFSWLGFGGLVGWFWFRGLVDWFWFRNMRVDFVLLHTSQILSAPAWEKKLPTAISREGSAAENRANTVPWLVQFWGFLLWFGRKTKLQRGGMIAKFTPIHKATAALWGGQQEEILNVR